MSAFVILQCCNRMQMVMEFWGKVLWVVCEEERTISEKVAL